MDDNKVRTVDQPVGKARRHRQRIILWFAAATAIEVGACEATNSECFRIKIGMLTGQDQARHDPTRSQRMRDGCKLYRFGTGSNDQPYVGKTQSSP